MTNFYTEFNTFYESYVNLHRNLDNELKKVLFEENKELLLRREINLEDTFSWLFWNIAIYDRETPENLIREDECRMFFRNKEELIRSLEEFYANLVPLYKEDDILINIEEKFKHFQEDLIFEGPEICHAFRNFLFETLNKQ